MFQCHQNDYPMVHPNAKKYLMRIFEANQDEIHQRTVLANFHLHGLAVPRLDVETLRKRIEKWWVFQIYVSVHEMGRF